MASVAVAAAEEEAKFKTLVLKVSIHCEGCKRKVSKILRKIEGVESVDIDTRQNKVSFKSLVDAQTVIQKLKKHGKPAELLEEVSPSVRVRKPATETEKPPPEPAKIGVESNSVTEAETVMAVDNSVTEDKEAKDEPPPLEKPEKVKPKTGDKNVDDTLKPSNENEEEEEEKSKIVEELKDDHHTTSRQVFPPKPAYVMSYDMAQPSMSQSHFVPPPMATVSSQGNIYDDQYWYNFPRYYDAPIEAHPDPTGYLHQQANDPYNNTMFSDENPDASCSLM